MARPIWIRITASISAYSITAIILNNVNIYLNIDGVVRVHSSQAALYADEFLRLLVRRWPKNVYWLTMQSRGGRFGSQEVLISLVQPQTYRDIRLIQPGNWRDHKTDAINFHQPFLWYDEMITPEEQRILQHHRATECYRQLSLHKDPHQLIDEIEYLRSLA